MNNAPLILLVLVGLVVLFGVGVVIANRRKKEAIAPAPSAKVEPVAPPPRVEKPAVAKPVTEPFTEPFTEVAEAPVEAPVEEIVEAPVAPARRFARAAGIFSGSFSALRAKDKITSETWDDLEETLLRADVGLSTTTALLDELRQRTQRKEITQPRELLDALQAEMAGKLSVTSRDLIFDESVKMPNIWLFVGVNGVGKTTTIGKVAFAQKNAGRSVLLAAGDTFRAAAGEQLETWAQRAEVPIVRGSEGGDPSAVIFDAVQSAAANGRQLVLGDTAGRLQNKTNLMEELKKVRRVAEKEAGTVTEVLLVIDATTGQNGLAQAEQFAQATNVTGVVLTKLDGSAKGGIVFAIETQLGIPVKLVGLGETIDDLVPFVPEEYVRELFAEA
jgi:fused signal recognition particle receptor